MCEYTIPFLSLPYDLETKAVLKKLNRANRFLAELKGVALMIIFEKYYTASVQLSCLLSDNIVLFQLYLSCWKDLSH